MSVRRLLPILMLALALAPFGRAAAAEGRAMPHHQLQAPRHCPDQPPPAGESEGGKMAIDCMIACAAMAAVPESFIIPSTTAPVLPEPAAVPRRPGIRPEADPPPPRFA